MLEEIKQSDPEAKPEPEPIDVVNDPGLTVNCLPLHPNGTSQKKRRPR